MRTIRTTNRPDDEIEVDEAEYLDLVRQGLVIEDEAVESVPPDSTPDEIAKKKKEKEAATNGSERN